MNHIEVAPVERRELLGEIVAVHPRADCAIKPHYGFPRCFVYGIYVRFSIVVKKQRLSQGSNHCCAILSLRADRCYSAPALSVRP